MYGIEDVVVVREDERDDEIHRNTHLYTKNGTDASDYQMTITLCDGVTMKTQLFQNQKSQNLCNQLHKYNIFWRTLFCKDEKKYHKRKESCKNSHFRV